MWTASPRAKINLHLAVHARRPDGFHAVTTVFQTIDFADALTVVEHDGPLVLRCPGSEAPEDASNLVVRAAKALATRLGRPEPTGLAITLEKYVPTQAGLGGGSADAMAMLRLLCDVWGVPPDRQLLMEVGRTLGSDVPYFALGGTVLGRGRGDELTPLPPLPPLACAIVRPAFGVPTGDAYRWVAESRAGGAPARPDVFVPPTQSEHWLAAFAACRNDFEPVVAARHPEITEIVATLRAHGAVHAMLSGSGSAVFGLFAADAAADAAVAGFAGRDGWRVWRTSTW
jgi:4-diphosphocytidyl-2-C-methyl-D-erythritol kinase